MRAADSTRPKKRFLPLFILLGAALCLIGLCLSPLFPFLRSLAVMGVYSALNARDSLPREQGFTVQIPGGLATKEDDWYPFVMTYVADAAYAAYTGEPDARLTILYNFPSFDLKRGASRLYEPSSPYYNGFYGAYIVRDQSNMALSSGQMDLQAAATIAQFDFFTLVLEDFGLSPKDEVFSFTTDQQQDGISIAGYEGWHRVVADITVNGASHTRRDFSNSYLQYGAPNFIPPELEFAPVEITGLLYARYFPEWDAGIYLYAMGDPQIISACDEQILAKTRISIR